MRDRRPGDEANGFDFHLLQEKTICREQGGIGSPKRSLKEVSGIREGEGRRGTG